MTLALIYGYGYGGSGLILVFVVLLVVRMAASGRRRSGRPFGRGPFGGSGPWGPGQRFPTGGAPGPSPSGGAPVDAFVAGPASPAATPQADFKIPPGWFPDPTGKFDQRYWSGRAWTEHVTKDGVPSTDAPPASLSGTG